MATQPQTEQRALTVQTSPLILELAGRWKMTPATMINTIKATVLPQKDKHGNPIVVSDAQLMMFLQVAHEYALNPFTKEIYAFPTKGGGVVPMVPIDGWANIVNRNPLMDGVEFEDIADEKGKLSAIRCRIYRKDRAHPTEVTEYLSECFQPGKDPWEKWPARMLRHKAFIQCARIAFSLAGIYDPDEAERIVESEARREPPAPITRPKPVIQGGNAQVVDVEPKAESQREAEPRREEADTVPGAEPSEPANGAAPVATEPAAAPGQPTGADLFGKPKNEPLPEKQPGVEYVTQKNISKLCVVWRSSLKKENFEGDLDGEIHRRLEAKFGLKSLKLIPLSLYDQVFELASQGLKLKN